MSEKKVMITGATSFIGTALIRQLIKDGSYKIVAVVAVDSTRKGNVCKSEKVEIIESDLEDIDQISLGSIGSLDSILHVGWSGRFTNPRYNLEGQMQNVKYLEKVITLADRLGCKRVLGIGSQAECGCVSVPISETTPDHPETAYAAAKCRAYDKGMELCARYGIEFFWPRLLSAYGPGDKIHTMIMICLDAAIHKKKVEFTKCEQIWDYIYVDDVADALLRIVNRGTPGVKYPIASGKGKKLVDYVFDIADIAEAPFLLEGIGKRAYADNQVMHLVGDIERLYFDTGFVPKVSFREGIVKTIHADFKRISMK